MYLNKNIRSINISIAFIGAGNMAKAHAKAFKDIPNVSLIGVFNRTKSRAEALAKEFQIMKVYNSTEELWRGTKADLVVISVRELGTKKICFEAFQYPWICLIEKPAGYNLEDAALILREAEARQARAYVALNRRHYFSTRIVLKEIQKSEECRLVNVFDQENPQVALEAGEHPLIAQNWMFANSVHVIDYFSIFCRGKIQAVSQIIPWNPLDPGIIATKLSYSSGDIGLYQAVWNRPGPWAVALTTKSKRWEMRPLEKATVQIYKSKKANSLPGHPWDSQFKPGLRLQAEEAVRAVKGLPHQLPSLKEAFGTMELIQKIYNSKTECL